MQLVSYLEGGPLMWMMLLHIHVNLNTNDDDDNLLNFVSTHCYDLECENLVLVRGRKVLIGLQLQL